MKDERDGCQAAKNHLLRDVIARARRFVPAELTFVPATP